MRYEKFLRVGGFLAVGLAVGLPVACKDDKQQAPALDRVVPKPELPGLKDANKDGKQKAPEPAPAGVVAPHPKPLCLKNSASGVILYVESDGRHMAAIDEDGKILWHKIPFFNVQVPPSHLKPKPFIVSISPDAAIRQNGKLKVVSFVIKYSVGATGALDERTGAVILPIYVFPKPKPLSCKDSKTGVVIYVESDGRHVAAIDKDGNILWHKIPFRDDQVLVYVNSYIKTEPPFIRHIGMAGAGDVSRWPILDPKRHYIYIYFTTRGRWVLDIQTGAITFLVLQR